MNNLLLMLKAATYFDQIIQKETNFAAISNPIKNNISFSSEDKRKLKTLISCSLRKYFIIDSQINFLSITNVSKQTKSLLHVYFAEVYYLKILMISKTEFINYIKQISTKEAIILENKLESVDLNQKIDLARLVSNGGNYLSLRYNVSPLLVKLIVDDYGTRNSEKILSFLTSNYAAYGRVNTNIVSADNFYKENKDFIEKDNYFVYKAKTHIKAHPSYPKMEFYTLTLPEIFLTEHLNQQVKNALIVEDDKTSIYLDFQIVKNISVDMFVEKQSRYYSLGNVIKSFNLKNVTLYKELGEVNNKLYDLVYLPLNSSNLGLANLIPDFFINFEEINPTQHTIVYNKLVDGSRRVKKGGLLIYKFNSILKKETEGFTKRFKEEHREFELIEEKFYLPQNNDSSLAYVAKFRKK